MKSGAAAMGISEIIGNQREQILALAKRYGASNVRVFGSVVHGTADEKSDVDFLVDMEAGRTLLDMGGLLMELQELLKRDVDVVTPAGLRPRIRERVLEEARPL
ncbi:MAG TPA: nucleotidyltransferase family protein [Sedimentisphaerales bacterium]|nr:nucleotidyltransferase family protein [Sedimentisphaerales bacterium]